MLDILITKKSIAVIFQEERSGNWKIVFGDSDKKLIDYQSDNLEAAILYVEKLGFGGYKTVDYSTFLRCRLSCSKLTSKKASFKFRKIMFSDEKDWYKIYKSRYAVR
jgi:hypothetical protein